MGFTGIILLGFSILFFSFVRLLVTNSLISAFISRKLSCSGRLKIIKSSVLSILAELTVFFCMTIFISIQLVNSIYGDVVHKIFMSIQAGIVTVLGSLDYENPSSMIYVVFEITITFILLLIINYFFILKNLEISKGKKFLLSLCCAGINAPYHFLIPFGNFDFFDQAVMNWMF